MAGITNQIKITMKNNFQRRHFIKTSIITATSLILFPSFSKAGKTRTDGFPMRIGGPVYGKLTDPADWVKAVKALRYSAAYCPVQTGATGEIIRSFRAEAKKNNILISEVGAWSNTLDPNDENRKEALRKNIESLQLADEIGANCCVNISGARGEIWDGPYAGNYSKETFDLIVETVRYIIDQVKPAGAFYTLEPMPYMLPDSPDSYLKLIKMIDRKQFGVHLDPVNMISSPQLYFNNGSFLKECFTKLGPYIKSIHAKDITIMPELTLHLEERRPGLGSLDYEVFLTETSKLNNIPLMLEHLDKQEDYKLAAEYVREMGGKVGVSFIE